MKSKSHILSVDRLTSGAPIQNNVSPAVSLSESQLQSLRALPFLSGPWEDSAFGGHIHICLHSDQWGVLNRSPLLLHRCSPDVTATLLDNPDKFFCCI